jgi:hypothetical protein
MIDRIIVPSSVHVGVAILLVVLSVVTTIIVGRLAWHNRPLTRLAQVSLAATQLVLLIQLMIGIKLLDQGSGPLQLYVHYMGGMLPIVLFLVMRWLPGFEKNQARISAAVMAITLATVVMTATIGSAFVRGTL